MTTIALAMKNQKRRNGNKKESGQKETGNRDFKKPGPSISDAINHAGDLVHELSQQLKPGVSLRQLLDR